MSSQQEAKSLEELAGNARSAMQRRDWPAALALWGEIRTSFPERPDGYIGAGETLLEAGRADDADQLLGEARSRFPDDFWVAFHQARAAAAHGDPSEAIRRFQQLRREFSGQAVGYVGLAEALSGAGRLEEAEAVVSEARARFPDDFWVSFQYGQTAHLRGNFSEAVSRFEQLAGRFPAEPSAHVRWAEALARAGRRDEAEAVLSAARTRFPDDFWVLYHHAASATARRDWEEAHRRWVALQQVNGDNREAWERAGEALWEAGRLEELDRYLAQAIPRFGESEQLATLRSDLELQRAVTAQTPPSPPSGHFFQKLAKLWKGPEAGYARSRFSQGADQLTVAIQCFNKPDTLKAECRSLLACDGRENVDLIFWIDSPVGSRAEERNIHFNREVETYLADFSDTHATSFRSLTVRRNEVNLGWCKTCEVVLDFAFSRSGYVLFAEDDIIFAHDALKWFSGIERRFDDDRVWAIGGESIFFISGEKTDLETRASAAFQVATRRRCLDKYIHVPFIPSACFATTRDRWRIFSKVRGRLIGDVALNTLIRNCNKTCILPVVARAKDIGQHHDNGSSVLIHGKQAVPDKNCYLISDDLDLGAGPPSNFEELGREDRVAISEEFGTYIA